MLVTILDGQGQTLEQGEATHQNGSWWEFKKSTPAGGKVIVEVFDLAGNCTKYEA